MPIFCLESSSKFSKLAIAPAKSVLKLNPSLRSLTLPESVPEIINDIRTIAPTS